MSKFDTEKDGRLVELYQDHREKLEGHSIIRQSKFSNFVTHPLRFFSYLDI